MENGTGLWGSTKWGEGRLIGVIDFNIDPDHVSFAGVGMKTPPQWRGTCDFRCTSPATCSCTSKLLGATIFNMQPKEDTAHGTMVASIAAGDFVAGAEDYQFSNYAKGIAAGASPKSYLSFYSGKVGSNFLKAIEQAIRDRVDILCISLSLSTPAYYENFLSIGTLSAVEQGIFVAMAAGNYGPRPASVRNDAPWLLTVGASTHDRASEVALYTNDTATGVRRVYYGLTHFTPRSMYTNTLQLVYPGEGGGSSFNDKTCNSTLGGKNVQGAIVLCWRNPRVTPFLQAETVRNAGGRAIVLMNSQMEGEEKLDNVPYLHISSVVIKRSNAHDILQRYNFEKRGAVTATLWPSKSVFNIRPFPVVAGFSSRGPSAETKGFLKPDILGPGVNILGARSTTAGSTVEFEASQGTSFATPHLAAIAALLKSSHPDWSPAAMRSAIMTTADIEDSCGNRITNHTGKTASFYDTGAGQVNPERANDPGLVYNITDTKDYVRVLCSMYTQAQVNKFAKVGRIVNCSTLGKLEPEQLNYPSIAMTLSRSGKKTIQRTVTNVGRAASEYKCSVEGVPMTQVQVSVKPDQLTFTSQIKEASFMVEAELVPGSTLPSGMVVEGFLTWTFVQGGEHVVRSPLALIVP
ncbi:hypothetical protein Taro_030392 [Colocasia esculenta]|uniref:Subtilisin-like protease n=1 Tax=Colocasia esculenta TaxID=4460 RepID=A0A843VW12_COLES|nr:hypothetical protein [Colocasia esculenta]